MSETSANRTGALFALLGFALFSGHDVIVKMLGDTYSVFQIIFFSVLFSFPLVVLFHLPDRNEDNLMPHHPVWVFLRTCSTVITAVAAFYAFSVLPLAQTYALMFCMPLLITVLAIPILGEQVGAHRWAAVILGFVGVLIVLRPASTALTLGHVAALTAALCGALSTLIVRKIGNEERTIVLMLYPMFANLIVLGPLAAYSYTPIALEDIGLLGCMAVLGFLAMLCIIKAYRIGEAAVVAPMHYSQMLWAALYGIVLFQEFPDRMTMLGSAVIVLSGLYLLLRERRRKDSSQKPVLSTRSRMDIGITPRISLLLKRRS